MSLCTHGVQTGAGYECAACVTTITTPHIVAGLDQEIAELDEQIAYMVRMFKRHTVEKGELQTVADLAATVNAMYDGVSRGELVAVAVRRLAAEEPSGGAAALRADVEAVVLEEVEALRRDIRTLGELPGDRVLDLLAGLDRIEALVREATR